MVRLSNITRLVDIALIGAIAVSVVIACGFLWTSPIAFQRASAIIVDEEPVIDWDAPSPALDALRVIGSIPYSSVETIYEVLPSQIYELTMLRGLGNCANKTRGMTFFLDRAGIPFQRIDFFPVDGFMYGKGHTIIRTKYEYGGDVRVGVIDVLEGSLLTLDGQPIDLPELRVAKPFTMDFLPLSRRCDGQSDYYGSFLEKSVIAVTDPHDTKRYLDFIESVYFPIGSPRASRIIFNGLAVFAGVFPRQRVSQADYERLFADNMAVVHAATTLRWSVRASAILVPLSLVLHGIGRWRRRSSAKPESTVTAVGQRAAMTGDTSTVVSITQAEPRPSLDRAARAG